MEASPDSLSGVTHEVMALHASEAYRRLVCAGSGSEAARAMLQVARPEQLLSRPPTNRAEAAAMLSGLWLWHDWLDEAHRVAPGAGFDQRQFLARDRASSGRGLCQQQVLVRALRGSSGCAHPDGAGWGVAQPAAGRQPAVARDVERVESRGVCRSGGSGPRPASGLAPRCGGGVCSNWNGERSLITACGRRNADGRRGRARIAGVNCRPSGMPPFIARCWRGCWATSDRKGTVTSTAAPGGASFFVFPGSGLFKKPPAWLMAAEVVETTRLYGRTAARIAPEWIERLAEHLVHKSYSEPHWQADSAHVVAYEKVTLYGLVVVPRRTVHYGPIDPKVSRELFIHHALVEGEYKARAPFFDHNRKLIEAIRDLEAKARKRDVLVEVPGRYAFYDARIPQGIYNGPLFEAWRKQAEARHPRLLFMSKRDLMLHGAQAVTAELFPDVLTAGSIRLALEYHLEPGHAMDGVTAIVPVAAINQLPGERFAWLVPGLLEGEDRGADPDVAQGVADAVRSPFPILPARRGRRSPLPRVRCWRRSAARWARWRGWAFRWRRGGRTICRRICG